MKALLISANRLKFPYPVYPLGLDYLADVMMRLNHEIRIADMNEISDESLQQIIREFAPDIVGISLRNVDNIDVIQPKNFISEYRELTEIVRNTSEAPIILGGSGFTLFPLEMMKSLDADYGIIGEGEKIGLLLKAIENKEDPSAIPGVLTKKTGQLSYNLNYPSFKRHFDPDTSHVRFYLNNGGMLNLQTKRGCHYHCIYCTYPHIEGKKLRLIPPDEVARTALNLQKTGAKYFYVTDSLFNSDYAHSIAVARAFIKAGVRIPWGAFFGPTEAPEDFYRIMADSGLTHVEFGTESLSDRMLASYKKPFAKHHVFEAHRAACEAGLHVAHFFLIGGPCESHETLNETLSSVDKLTKSVIFVFCGIRLYPNTELCEIAVREGQISKTQSLSEPVFYKPESISLEDIVRRVESHAANRPNWVIGSGVKHIEQILSRMYKQGYSGPLWERLIRRN